MRVLRAPMLGVARCRVPMLLHEDGGQFVYLLLVHPMFECFSVD